jgi:ribonuclease P protein component
MLPKKHRMPAFLIKNLKDVTPDKIYKGRFFLLKYYSTSKKRALFCIIVSKKYLSKASHRNLVKRRVRSILTSTKGLKSGNYVFIARGSVSKNITYEDLNSDINTILSKVF